MTRNSRHLTVAQQEEYRAKWLCFRCWGKYSALHKCPAKTLAILLEADEDAQLAEGADSDPGMKAGFDEPEIITELQHLQLSQLSSVGLDGAQTLKLFSLVHNRRLLTMVDSGASYCFISD